MLFTSYEFLGFITVLFIAYYLIPKRFQWMLLLAASYIFYFLCGASFLIYIVATTVTTYGATMMIDKVGRDSKEYLASVKETITREEKKAYKDAAKKKQWHWTLACLIFNIGMLAVIKYTNFNISNVNSILAAFGSEKRLSFWNIALPMGISFYIFQSMGYLIDVYRGTVSAERNFFKLALFVSFFPQLVQGPISRFGDLSVSLFAEHDPKWKNIRYGLMRILWGFFKKLVIADRILIAVNTIIHDPENYSGVFVFVGMMFYALELYADFTGGIDVTIGVAQVLGITVKENFERPFFSKNIKEYWNRWHITMGSWFTDYIFYPISVSKPMLKLSKSSRKHLGEAIGKRVPVYLSAFVVWFATGIWHGASWNFIVWGLGNFVVIMISQELEPLYAKFHKAFPKLKGTRGYDFFQVIRTVLLMSALRSFDCYRDVPLTFKMFGTIFTEGNFRILFDGSLLGLGIGIPDYIILAVGLVLLVLVSLMGRSGDVREKLDKWAFPLRFIVIYGLFLAVLLMGAYGAGYDASQFIYNQF